MSKKLLRLVAIILIMCMVIAEAPAAFAEPAEEAGSDAVPLNSISLNKTSQTLDAGKRCLLKVRPDPADTTDSIEAVWESSDESVATVGDTGIVKAVSKGTAVITAYVGEMSAECVITVMAPLKSISLNKKTQTLDVGKRFKLTVGYSPKDTTDSKDVTWTTSDKNVAVVSNSGIVTAVGRGTAKITAKVGSRTAVCTVTVKVPLKSIYLDKTSLNLEKGKTTTLTVGYNPADTTDKKTVTWTTSNKKVATVSKKGRVTAKSAGVATITAKVGNKKAVFVVTVTNKKGSEEIEYSVRTIKEAHGTRILYTRHPALKYSYEVKLLSPSVGYMIFVKTGNPDPTSFRLVDTSVGKGEIGYSSSYLPVLRKFSDVKYENEKTFRVNGGYIFIRDSWAETPDGGTLSLEILNEGNNPLYYGAGMRGGYEEDIYGLTNVKVKCPSAVDLTDYLIANFTDKKDGLFTNLDRVESALNELAVYPKAVVNTASRKPGMKFPALAASPYSELGLNTHYEIYQSGDPLLLAWLYPFVLSSASFPGTMAAVAKKLQPKCKVETGYVHWLVDITYKGKTKSYGGAGTGTSNEIYTKDIGKYYSFTGAEGDYYNQSSQEQMREKLIDLGKKGDNRTGKLQSKYPLYGEKFDKAVGNGAWIRVAVEGSGGNAIACVMKDAYWDSVEIVSNAWIDGRYVNSHEIWEKGAKFSDYPRAGIVKKNMTYSDRWGKEHTGDVLFTYDESLGKWSAARYYSWYTDDVVPANFFLTEKQVKAMKPAKNTNLLPIDVLIYDGSAKPGTAAKNVRVESLKLNKTKVTLASGSSITVKATVSPSKATYKKVSWKSSNENVATVYDGTITAVGRGTAVITATTYEGKSAKVTVKVTAKKEDKKVLEYDMVTLSKYNYTWDGKKKTPAVTVKYKGKKLKKGTDYTVSYNGYSDDDSRKNPGTYLVDITGKGEYSGNVQLRFHINLEVNTSIISAVRNNGKVTVRWKKQPQANGYIVTLRQYNKDGSQYVRRVTVKDPAKTKLILPGLSGSEGYWVYVRPYKTIGKKNYDNNIDACAWVN